MRASATDFETGLKFYDPDSSLNEDIQALSEKKVGLYSEKGEKLVLNIIAKYFFHYLLRSTSPEEPVAIETLAAVFANFGSAIEELPQEAQEFLETEDGDTIFPISMVYDVLRTATLVRLILKQKKSTDEMEDTCVVDAGTGTGILLLFQRIGMERQGIREKIQYVGIEKLQSVADRTHDFLTTDLEFSDMWVEQGDATEVAQYESLPHPVSILLNENIASPGAPLSNEPYVEVKDALRISGKAAPKLEIVPGVFLTADQRLIGIVVNNDAYELSEVGQDFAKYCSPEVIAHFRDSKTLVRWSPDAPFHL